MYVRIVMFGSSKRVFFSPLVGHLLQRQNVELRPGVALLQQRPDLGGGVLQRRHRVAVAGVVRAGGGGRRGEAAALAGEAGEAAAAAAAAAGRGLRGAAPVGQGVAGRVLFGGQKENERIVMIQEYFFL